MKLYDQVMPVLQLIENSETATLALFTAYINDQLGYEIFCGDLSPELFDVLQDDIKDYQELRDALNDSGIIQQGAEIYIDKAFEDCNMLYHFMDGVSTILNDQTVLNFVSDDDRHMLECIFELWREGTICEKNWEDVFAAMCTERASK